MRMMHIGASRPLIRPSGTFSPLGRRGKRDGAASPSPQRGEGGGSRMRGPHGTTLPPEGGI